MRYRNRGSSWSSLQNGKERVIAHASRVLTSPERNWHTQEKEAFAMIWAIKHFRAYLYGSDFLIKMVHKSLKWVLENPEHPNPRIRRWAQYMSEFKNRYKIDYRVGLNNANADALSRILPSTTD